MIVRVGQSCKSLLFTRRAHLVGNLLLYGRERKRGWIGGSEAGGSRLLLPLLLRTLGITVISVFKVIVALLARVNTKFVFMCHMLGFLSPTPKAHS